MANYKGGTSTICPYYEKEAAKSITCQGIISECSHMNRFATKEAKLNWQEKVCSTYNYISCPIAQMIEKQMDEEESKNKNPKLSEDEQILYDYIVEYMTRNLSSPSVREMCKATFHRSTETVYNRLRKLEQLGLIEIKSNKKRNIKLKGYELIKKK